MVYEKNGVRIDVDANAESVFVRNGWSIVDGNKANKSVATEKVVTENKPANDTPKKKTSKKSE